MQALLDFVIRNLLSLWPIVQVNEWERAAMVRNGRIQRALSAGLHWRWLFIERKIDWAGTEVVISLATCSITTRDGKAIALEANLGYRLIDIVKSKRSLWSMETSLKAAAAGVVCSELSQCAWTEMQGVNRKEREAALLATLKELAAPWGIEIVRVHLVACVEARQHRHFIDGSLSR
jgi:regulator of protease activity HflC (stomatin/prohibitin superfamily)